MEAPKGGGPEGWRPRSVVSPVGWALKGAGPEGWRPKPRKSGAPKGGARRVEPRRVGGPTFLVFFFLLPATIFFLPSSLSGCLLVEFWWCLKRRGPEMCTFGVLGLSCASPGGPVCWGRRGFTRQPESPNVNISGFRPSKTPTKFNERTPRERRKNENCGGRREKKERNFGRSGGGWSGGGWSSGGWSSGNGVQGSGFWAVQKQNEEMSKNKKKK